MDWILLVKDRYKKSNKKVTLVVYWLVCLPLDPKVACSNPDKAMEF
jgi:hypothetical protein